MRFQPFDVVRVAMLRRPPEAYDGWGVNQRPPRVGDVGAVVEVLESESAERYVVECSAGAGAAVWLAEFDFDELEAVKTS